MLASALEFLLLFLRRMALVSLIGFLASFVGFLTFCILAPRWGIVVDAPALVTRTGPFIGTFLFCFALGHVLQSIAGSILEKVIVQLRQPRV